jgi:uncharacterized protein
MVQAELARVAGHPLFVRGVGLYRAGHYFECHEVLEELWTPMRGPHRLFLQSLIHFAVALYHQERGNPVGAERQLRKALRKIAGYVPVYEGIDTAALEREGQAALERIRAGLRADPPGMNDYVDRSGDSAVAG